VSLAPGSTLSHYRLVEQIGEGGMGVVWRATDTSLGRDVAIKVVPDAFARDPERMARFEREARVLASLNHSGIAAIYGVGEAGGARFLAMELVEGEDLAVRIAQGPVPVVETLELARQIAVALEVAHEKGIIHRDLKPANVKVTPDGTAKVLDFGLAKAIVGDPSTSGPTSTPTILPTMTSAGTAIGMILGTAAYMSPEQARGKAVDRRADIWAFGCVVFECLTGQRAFTGETVSDTLAKILEREPDLSRLPGGTPAQVRELLQRCLVKDPKLRLRDIGDARIALDEVLSARSPSGQLRPAAGPVVAAARPRTPLVSIAIAGAAGLALGAVLWGVFAPRTRAGAGVEPRCLSVAMPAGVRAGNAVLTADGSTLLVLGQPKNADGSVSPDVRVYVRRLEGYEYRELPGTAGVYFGAPSADGRTYYFIAPIAAGATQLRLARVPLDGTTPATTVTEWKSAWNGLAPQENGDLIVREGTASFVRIPKDGGAPSPPVKIDAGRPGVSRYEFGGGSLPDGRGVFVDVVLYDARGWHYSVGVMDPKTGKVKIIEEDGGNARYSPTGHVVFSRGDAILAAPFDVESMEIHGAPVAVWSGLSAFATYTPGRYLVTREGALFYRPGQLGADRAIALLDATGRIVPWSSKGRALDFPPAISPDGRQLACQIISTRGIDEIWISPVDRDDFHRLGTEPNADSFFPTWSPDSKRVAYRRKGSDDKDGVHVMSVNGGEPKRIFTPESGQDNYDANSWLPDGSGLLVTHAVNGVVRVELLPMGGGDTPTGPPRPLALGEFSPQLPMISPDGKVLAFQTLESGKLASYVAVFHPGGGTGRPVEVKTSGSLWHEWSADGKSLFVQDESNHLMKVPVSTAPELAAGAPKEICDLDKLRIIMWSALPGDRFLVGLKNENEDEVATYNVVLNWTEILKRKMEAAR
jgi:serine/threonine-protein kinase